MKKILIGLVVLIALLGGVVFYVFSNLDALVKGAIETAGTEAVGASVQVGSVELDLLNGSAAIYDFSIANPEGFSDAAMVSFDELSVVIDINSLNGEMIRIKSIVAKSPFVLYESHTGRSNLDVVSARFASDENASVVEESADSGDAIRLAIDSIFIGQIQGTMQADELPEPIALNLGDINLQNLSGTPEEIASQVMGPLLSQLANTAATALLSALAGIDLENLDELAQERVDEELEKLEDRANAELDEAIGEELRKGLGGLLKR